MKNLDNKGQSLIAFILLLPVMLVFITGLWEVGQLEVTKNKYESEIKDTIKYGLKHIKDENIGEKLEIILNRNLKGQKEISIDENQIKIRYEYDSKLFNKKEKTKITYIGHIENNNMIIEKEG